MFVNKLLPAIQPPLNLIKGTVKARKQNSEQLTSALYRQLSKKFKDEYSVVSYPELEKEMKDILPVDNFKISVTRISHGNEETYDGLCTGLTDANNNINSVSIEVDGISDTIRAYHMPVFLHEFQHAADELYNPKYLSRSQKLLKKGLDNEAYNNFYEEYYYCEEYAKSHKKKHYVLKLVKRKTEEFLKNFDISDKLDYLQDMRYSLMSEINAYKAQRKTAKLLKSRGIKINSYNFENYPAIGMFEEKIRLINKLIRKYINQERESMKNI